MDQKELADSLGKHLDAAAETTYWGLLLAVVFLWAGLVKQDPIKALGMEIGRGHALYVAFGSYLIANLFVFIHFLRVGDILLRVDDATFPLALTKMCTHKWVANPFAFFGGTLAAKFHGSCGVGLLIVLWWIGNASLYSFVDVFSSPLGLFLLAVYTVIGNASLLAIYRVFPIVQDRLVDSKLHSEFAAARPYMLGLMIAGNILGGLIWFAVNVTKFVT